MKVASFKKINSKGITIPSNPNLERKLIIFLFVGIVVLGISYGYFVKQTIVNVVSRQNVEEEMGDLGSRVSNLEVRYIELKNKIDLDFAYSLGYKDVSEVKFVSRSELSKTLTLYGNQ
ncbi:MAG TPA: hypothetical protein QGH03_01970 [Candidatus Paceibacterota bacterium]|jgi:hypothetical protein|nr:hypothetical protein [Parcubacteria group bacterium]MDP6119639.1 hypothetical protein [Candidatus Paceibacterota bacterium]MDP7320539.1 hypothetical protein [Bacteriovoracaceae bacterium]HJN62977.1 hypothetical protein [Candidatus Paceibacterota bacterium]|tara:strand:- start:3353 stop:3706 length:354 start_codon:yes stop_codon:yes gene_type:complete